MDVYEKSPAQWLHKWLKKTTNVVFSLLKMTIYLSLMQVQCIIAFFFITSIKKITLVKQFALVNSQLARLMSSSILNSAAVTFCHLRLLHDLRCNGKIRTNIVSARNQGWMIINNCCIISLALVHMDSGCRRYYLNINKYLKEILSH